ncbi:hypothetical protein [Microbispora sp. GKU 823]|uniref:hypothetical protein n=1 Tax=Microbispora sp. GKU 823 TaxID=1652100 RepID=UPI0009A44DF7|nr:hypothetical protein [Microbispora sp. GKU 823]OPG13670.1 hypothetical protein B1L11_06700 [Microbispora sp. GKU 823]
MSHQTTAEELRAAAARLRSTPIHPATHNADIVKVGGDYLAACVDCGTCAEADAVPAGLLAALLNARAPLADLLERMAVVAENAHPGYKIHALDAALTAARTITTGSPADTPAMVTAQHAAIRDDERHRIAAHLQARAKAIEDTRGENRDWLAEQFATHLPTLPIGGAVQGDPRTIAIEAYRGIAFILTADIPPAPEVPEAPHAALSATEPDARPQPPVCPDPETRTDDHSPAKEAP